jgi:outer membrane protein insertion porin family
MRRIMMLVALAFAFLAPPVSAEDAARFRLERWELAGDRLLDRDEMQSFLPWAPGDSIPVDGPQQAAETVREHLVAAGWWQASVNGTAEDGVVTLAIDAGEPVVIGEIGVRGNLLLSQDEIFSQMDLRPGRTFSEAVFRSDVSRILREYSERGHPLARVYPGRFRRTEDGRLAFVLRVGEGPRAEIETVRVFGNSQTLENVVARIGGVKIGDAWNVRRVEGMSARLRREGLFTSVGDPRVVRGTRDNLLGVEIEVEEGPSNSIFGVLGYNPKPGGGGDVVGIVDLRFRNILGTARKAAIRFERQATNVQDLAFRYREPWVLGTPISLELGAAQALRDTLYSRTDLDVAVGVPIGDHSTASLAWERRDTAFDDAEGQGVDESSTGGSVAFTVDRRDRRVNPRSGWASDLLVGLRQTEAGETRTRTELDGHLLLPLGRRWIVSEEGGFRGSWSTFDEVPLYEQYWLGGTNTVRGYGEEQFHGERVWWIRSELRYRLSLRSRAYAFADVGGWAFRVYPANSPPVTEEDVILGTGVGISLETRGSGIVRFELALGRGDSFSEAKVHVGLEQEF